MNEIPTIATLRKLAELNFGPECYKQYLAIIEPGIESIIENYFAGWKSVESWVTQMVMRHEGVFKTNVSFISIEDDAKEKYGDKLDVDAFNKIKKRTFQQNIDYLHKNCLLGNSTYNLLHFLKEKRNTIHDVEKKFSEEDLGAFAYASSIVFYLHTAIMGSYDSKTKNQVMKDIENSSKYLLSIIKK